MGEGEAGGRRIDKITRAHGFRLVLYDYGDYNDYDVCFAAGIEYLQILFVVMEYVVGFFLFTGFFYFCWLSVW